MIKVLIVEDRKIIQHLLKHCLANYSDIEIVGIVNNGKLGVEQAELLQPDVIIMDVEMPEMDGLEASKIILEKNPQAKILIFSLHEEQEFIDKAMEIGARGYLLKTTSPEKMIEAIRSAHQSNIKLDKATINTSKGIYLSLNSNGKSATTFSDRSIKTEGITDSSSLATLDSRSFSNSSIDSVNHTVRIIEQDVALFSKRIRKLEKNTRYYRKIIVYLIILSGLLVLALVAAIVV